MQVRDFSFFLGVEFTSF